MGLKLRNSFFITTILFSVSLFSQNSFWKKTAVKGNLNGQDVSLLQKENSQALELNFNDFKEQLNEVPLRGLNTGRSEVVINLPEENGNMQSFKIFEAPVFSPSLSAKFPEIKSYVGFSVDNSGAVVRMSVSPKGVQTMISYKNKPTVFMQPIEGNVEKYIVYNRLSKTNLPKEDFVCSTVDEIVKDSGKNSITQRDANDQILRKFRLAVSVNGEYTQFHGGTVAGALSAINATITRVNAIFETDMAITFELQDFPELIYTDSATDPYSGSLSAWNVELQNTLTDVIGNDAYDIGHMFGASGGGGNAGCIGCVCRDDTSSTNDENKGAGITSPADGIPQGDTFDVDYVAHEIGHQMGANHTFSHSTEGTGVNAEPGSGSTIMGYAGITSSNVQQNSDPYFHYHSIKQVMDNVTNNRTCWQDNNPVTITNNPPNSNAGQNYTIPQGTAFVLRGTATDSDSGDNLMYSWEQTDSGQVTSGQFGPTRTVGAQARSLPPTTSPDRYIPKLSRVVAGQLTETNPNSGDDWETVSTVARDLNWALTVRDREPSATGLNGQSSFDTTTITVDGSSDPFVVTSQNTVVTWDTGSTQTITWDKAATDIAPINCANVKIRLSIDGGVTFPITLIESTPNDGTHTFSVPDTPSTSARIMIEAVDNIFYSVNSSNFTINSTTPTFVFANNTTQQSACNSGGNSVDYTLNLDFVNGLTEDVSFTTANEPAGSSISFSPSTINSDGDVTMTVSNFDGATAQLYTIEITGTSATTSVMRTVNAELLVLGSAFSSLTLTTPADGATDITVTPDLIWNLDSNASSYDVEVATDNSFSNIIDSGTVSTNSYTVSTVLNGSTQYFWRVKPKNECAEGAFSSAFSFTTEDPSYCDSTFSESTSSEWISNVTFNTINNNSDNDYDSNTDGVLDGYQDFTSVSTTVNTDEEHQISVTFDTAGFQDHVYVFIDWNKDYVFNITDERYDLGTHLDDVSTATLNITIPSDAVTGNTRMRVVLEYTGTSAPHGDGPCTANYASGWGETEDYTIEVQNPAASIEDFAFSGFNLYPNPSNGEINLAFEVINTDEVKTQLYDLRGRKVNQKTFKNVSTQFSEKLIYDNVSTGIYLLRISNGGKISTRKIIIK
ncbi:MULTISPECIES: reprolysin-like metallopeptidase [Tenacibaculum]|uniref:reprolysin-like metallopeptidase n=1 Tax=Tenacibaculum TaxID=104267 RepID=UPI001F0AE28B|nr:MULTISPECIES: zinc-dependent metalloprotease family protein [Tenacibaculum]MCH3880886.1 M12 family metallo-peptidase [Tenacibaculum aquimarinum]MDO6599515.1 zinc-dependent metalloprotease family protein [Tenacibaculum sp. 1_MG-2023]